SARAGNHPRPLGYREPAALGPRRRLRRGPRPQPQGPRTGEPRHSAQAGTQYSPLASEHRVHTPQNQTRRVGRCLPHLYARPNAIALGSSGAAVFNDRWEIVGLHHCGVPAKTPDGRTMAVDGQPWRPEMGEDRIKWIANEGVRISCIIKALRNQITNAAQRELFNAMLVSSKDVSPLVSPPVVTALSASPPESKAPATVGQDGSAVWTIPLTITVNVGGGAATPAPAPIGAAVAVTAPVSQPPAPAPKLEDRNPKEILAAAQTALKENRPNVMRVHLGYVFQDGRITNERALVV